MSSVTNSWAIFTAIVEVIMIHLGDMKNPWIVIGVLTIVLFGGAIAYSSFASERNNEGVVVQENIKGNVDAVVTLVEYSDFQCPACASFMPAVDEVMEQYGESIRFQYMHFPLPIHSYAQQAAVAAEAAGQQGQFFPYHDLLFANQQAWASASAPNALFIQYAEQLELDIPQFRRHMNSSVLRDKVRTEMNTGRELGITGTPTFFLNGERMQIATFQDFVEQIAAAVDPEAAVLQARPDTDESVVGESTGETVRFGL